MAKKTRKQKLRASARRPVAPDASIAPDMPAGPSTLATESEVEDASTVTDSTAAGSVAVDLGATEPARRRVERVAPTGAQVRPRPGRAQSSGFIRPLESEDAAIPFDRVPYVPADLRRVAIIATLMIALIIVADIIVSNVVK